VADDWVVGEVGVLVTGSNVKPAVRASPAGCQVVPVRGVVGGQQRSGNARSRVNAWRVRPPRPGALQAKDPAAGVADDPGGDMPQPVAQGLGLGHGQRAVQQQCLGPDGEVLST